jgi:hypothetical protein
MLQRVDNSLSRRRPGFESPWGRQVSRSFSLKFDLTHDTNRVLLASHLRECVVSNAFASIPTVKPEETIDPNPASRQSPIGVATVSQMDHASRWVSGGEMPITLKEALLEARLFSQARKQKI